MESMITLETEPGMLHGHLMALVEGGEWGAVEHLHLLSHRVPPGVFPDMTELDRDRDDWRQYEAEDGSRFAFESDFARRNRTIMTWNARHLARMLKPAGGYPNKGSDRRAWQAGARFGFENPEHRT